MKNVTKPPRISRLSVEPRADIWKKRSKPFRAVAVPAAVDMLVLPDGTVNDARMVSDADDLGKAQ
ncbi:hypothetical protein [Actinoplanes teichomyceticus]|uniref:hypothetical protein n=1 Tax=Actinoplanes teichomyceticus TaxID=1867 RepID=UPI001A58C51C|nr:hypothetical protein [Actinoplanes teichomyceticus]GIF15186.1 hypothetical protein Ate01nite_52180 [Actinoplanes teichomyceticus]